MSWDQEQENVALRATIEELQVATNIAIVAATFSNDAAQKNALKVRGLELQISTLRAHLEADHGALALSAQMLLTYKDYYGTSITQVKHLAECTECYLGIDAEEVRCFNYPSK